MIDTIIGLNGRLHSGKDTAYETIRDHFAGIGLVTQRAAFADPLKLSAARALGFDPESVEEAVKICDALKEGGSITTCDMDEVQRQVTGREYLQRYGTEAHRDVFGTDFWVDATIPRLIDDLDAKYPYAAVLVVTDVRFPNEAERILGHAGDVWHIDATGRLGELPDNAHVSEKPLPDILLTRTIENGHGLDDYYGNLAEALVNL